MTRFAAVAGIAAACVATGIDGTHANRAAAPASPSFRTRFAVAPDDAFVFPGALARFHLVTTGGAAGDVRWSVVGPGSITNDGTYRAGPSSDGDSAAVVAAANGRASAASVRIVSAPPASAPLAIVSCYDDGVVDVRAATSHNRFGTSSTGDRAAGIAADGRRRLVFVASGNRLAVLDLRTGLFSFSHTAGNARFSEVALLSGGYIVASDNNASAGQTGLHIFRIGPDGAPAEAGSALTGDTPEGIAATRDGHTFFVTNVNSNSVLRYSFDGRGHARLTGAAPTGHRPFGVAVDETRGMLFVADNDTAVLSGTASKPGLEEFSLPAMRRVAVVNTGTANALPLGIAVDAASNRMFVTNEGDATVAVYSIAPLRRIATLQTGRTPWLPAVDARGGALFVPSAMENSFAVFDIRTLRAIATDVGTCGYPTSIAIAR